MILNTTTGESGTHFSSENNRPGQRNRLRNRYEHDCRAKGRANWSDIRFGLNCRLLAGLLVLAGLTPCPLRGQTNAARATPPSERCLLIVETSKSMQRRSDAVLGAVRELLQSGLNGQFQDGGTLGVWTFNEGLAAGRFPLQTWSSSAPADITQRTLAFLKAQKCAQQANFDQVAPALSRVIEDSELLTLIIISSGDCEIRGTPCDDRINVVCQRWRAQQQKMRMPFVIIVRARRGQAAEYVVNTPPWLLQVPRLSGDAKSAGVSPDKFIEAVRQVPLTNIPPLIISGKKPQPELAPVPTPEPGTAKREVPLNAAEATAAKVSAAVNSSPPAAPPIEVAKAVPAPLEPEMPLTESAPKTAPPATTVNESKPEAVKAPEAKPAGPVPSKLEAAPPPPAPGPKLEPATVEPSMPSSAPEIRTEPVPAPPATREAPPAAAQIAPASAGISRPSILEPAPPARSTPVAQSATAVPAESLLRSRNIWTVGIPLAILAVGFTFLLVRRSHAGPQASLITRSIERDKKP